MSENIPASLTEVETRTYLLRALVFVERLAAEGIFFEGIKEEPADLWLEMVERLGTEEVRDALIAQVAG